MSAASSNAALTPASAQAVAEHAAALKLYRSASSLTKVYIEPLIQGERLLARQVIDKALASGLTAYQLLTELVWPVMEQLQTDYRSDAISITQLNFATRLNRSITDYLCFQLDRQEMNDRRVLVICGEDEPEELGGQITAELFQAAGYEVRFAGGNLPDDETHQLIGEFRPDLLLMFATLPNKVPSVRRLIDYLREINSNPQMQIMCCGGIYKRAEGLAEEIGADLYASDGASAVEVASNFPGRRASVDQQTVGRSRRIKKAMQRRSPVLGRIAPRSTDQQGDADDNTEE
jgi:MerR family transcriptional regulator, light-induced transcriptional regulator